MSLPKMSLSLLCEATKFASEKHRLQIRKNSRNTPYYSHPSHVALILQHVGVNDLNVVIAGLLHDTIEDTNTTFEELASVFGKDIADIVVECTDDKKLDPVERKKLQIIHANTVSTNAKLVKLADKYSNLSDLLISPPSDWSKNRINGYWQWSFAVVSKLKLVNEKFDELFEKLFKDSGVNYDNLEVKLEEYYKEL